VLELLEAWGPGPALRVSAWLYPIVNATHILGVGLLVSSAVLMDLRVLGAFGRRYDVETVLGLLRPAAVVGIFIALISRLLLFTVQPLDYLDNPAFRIKLLIVAAAAVNAAVFLVTARRAPRPGLAASALVSILLWLGALLAGRMIGFLN